MKDTIYLIQTMKFNQTISFSAMMRLEEEKSDSPLSLPAHAQPLEDAVADVHPPPPMNLSIADEIRVGAT